MKGVFLENDIHFEMMQKLLKDEKVRHHTPLQAKTFYRASLPRPCPGNVTKEQLTDTEVSFPVPAIRLTTAPSL